MSVLRGRDWSGVVRCALLMFALGACSSNPSSDAGVDAVSDQTPADVDDVGGNRDAVAEASVDAAVDAVMEASTDAASDAPRDGGIGTLSAWSSCPAPLPTTLQCATLTVPLDYDAPAGATAAIAVARVRAQRPEQRRGVVFFNPGGPGVSGIDGLASIVSVGTPLLGDALLYYDFVTFDVRGQGRSRPLFDCVDDSALPALLAGPAGLDAGADASPASLARLVLAQCQARTPAALIANQDTGAIARDLDTFREALREERLNYLGGSYGTWLGAVYAHLFASRVRAFVLDGPMPGTFDSQERELASTRGIEQALEDYFAWCDATPAGCTFRPSTGTTREAFLALRERLDATPLPVPGMAPVNGESLRAMLRSTLTSLDATTRLLSALRDGDPAPVTAARQPPPVDTIEVNLAIRALDTSYPAGSTLASVTDWARAALPRAAPLTGGGLDPLVVALQLGYPARPAHPVTSLTTSAPPTLVIAGRHDALTPLANARPFLDAMGNGSRLLISESWGHVGFVNNRCVRAAVGAFLLDPTRFPTSETCPVDAPPADQARAGTVVAAFPWSQTNNRTVETEIGDLVTDAMRARFRADLAVTNGGGIRAGLPSPFLPIDRTLRRPGAGYAAGPPFDLVREDARQVVPFGNRALVVRMTGRAIWSMLNASVALAPMASSSFLQLSGMRFSYSASAPAGSRVRSVTLDDGTTAVPNDDARMYTVVMTDFIYYGGAGPLVTPDGTGMIHEDVAVILADYLAAGPAPSPSTSTRITSAP